jgi:DNA repair exonuclease SbcCD ATPase subunit
MSKTKSIRQSLERLKGQRQQLKDTIKRASRKKDRLESDLQDSLKAQAIIHDVAKKTQEELRYYISDLVSMGIGSVFGDDVQFLTEFESKRGKIESSFFIVKHGKKIDPIGGSGGGAVDMVSLALRLSLWSLRQPKTRPILFLDEPLKWLKGADLPRKGAKIISEFSRKLDIQTIMVSHDPELIDNADRVIEVKNIKGKARVSHYDE